MPMDVTRRFEWDAAHRLPDHEGLCSNIHGHRYAAEVTCSSVDGIDDAGMVVDFSLLKDIIGKFIDEHWDHACLLYGRDKHPAVCAIRESEDMKVYLFTRPPTVEIIVHTLVDIVVHRLAARGLVVTRVKVWETPNCSAEWVPR
jgi:6-pyruvoyltetrahydropterin/6-carboxytetrahydropterin synthase